MEIPLVAVWMLTFNQEKFIEQAIQGVISQKANFRFKLFIGEDCSSDSTREICAAYQDRFPDLVHLRSTEKNNIIENAKNTYDRSFNSGAKYIAFCEGDDYWIDPLKLQKQVDFLEKKPDFTISCHAIYEQTGDRVELYPNNYPEESTFTIEDLARSNFISAPTVLFRNGLFTFPDWFYSAPAGDYVVHMLNARKGKINYMPEPMAVYRKNVGIWSSTSSQMQDIRMIKVIGFLKKEFQDDKAVLQALDEQVTSLSIHAEQLYCKQAAELLIEQKVDEGIAHIVKGSEFFPNVTQLFVRDYLPAILNGIYSSRKYQVGNKLASIYHKFKDR